MTQWFSTTEHLPALCNTDFGAWVSRIVQVRCGPMILHAYLDRGRDSRFRWLDDATGSHLKHVTDWRPLQREDQDGTDEESRITT